MITTDTKFSIQKFEPMQNFLVAKPFSAKETELIEAKKTSIKLPDSDEKKGRIVWARVIAINPTSIFKIGNVILLSEYDSYEIRVDGDEYLVIKEEFIFTKFNK